MLSPVTQQLAADHAAIDKVLTELHAAINTRNIKRVHSQLDRFWARLAVHIRAEQLQLFPEIVNRLSDESSLRSNTPSLAEAISVVERLRDDHDFFMRELSHAMAAARDLHQTRDQLMVTRVLSELAQTISKVEKRLMAHNEMEENQIYRWAATVLTQHEQTVLAARIRAELTNVPPRFLTESVQNENE
jgi:hemerythrin superfamily protein